MRGQESSQGAVFSYISLESRIPQSHPLRAIRRLVDEALEKLSERFDELYARTGRPSIAPERLLRALVLQVLYGIRSERQLIEQLDYNLLYRWFVGLAIDDAVWAPTVFTKNRDRLLEGEVAEGFFALVLEQARRQKLLSAEHFTVDGTLIEAWASHRSFRAKDGPPDPPEGGRNFHGERRTNETHASTSDPEARLARKGPGKEAKLSYLGNLLVENRHGLIVNTAVKIVTGRAEVEAAVEMVSQLPGSHRVTVAADKGYDTRDFVDSLRDLQATPHVSQSTKGRRSRIDGRTTRHRGYQVSLKQRPRVEGPIGWVKEYGGLRRAKLRGLRRVGWLFTLAATTFNLLRMANIARAQALAPI
jgi:transposase